MNSDENPATLILLSGGMNSAALILHLVRKLQRPIVEAMIFDRLIMSGGETTYAKKMAERAGVPYSTWPLELDPLIDMAVDSIPEEAQVFDTTQMARAIMMTKAAFRAKQRGCSKVVAGFLFEELNMLVDDLYLFTGAVSKLAGVPANLFEFPMLQFGKGDVFELARQEDILVEIGFHTMSCLNGEDEERHSWGYGCGECVGCERRSAGWEIYLDGLKK